MARNEVKTSRYSFSNIKRNLGIEAALYWLEDILNHNLI